MPNLALSILILLKTTLYCSILPIVAYNRLFYGKKAEVEEYFIKRGGVLAKSINKKTDYLIVGKHGSAMWSTGNYGNKVKKAIVKLSEGSSIELN